MSVADLEFRLPDDVDIVLDPDGREVILTRRGSRIPPQVLSAEAWALLERFRVPRTLTGAVLEHCADTGDQPLATLEAAFPVLVAVTRSELLVPAGTGAATSLEPRHTTAERVGPATLTGPIRVLRDSELWHGVLDDGSAVVVKVVDDEVIGTQLFARETTALRRLVGGPVPLLLWEESNPSGGVLVLSLVEGDLVDLAALDARGIRQATEAMRLVCTVLDVYAQIHERGVLHGDIHAGNVLADAAGRVTVIDFGISDIADTGLGPAPRTGGGEHLDPVAARALRDGKTVPDLDVGVEVYALASLAYRILTGSAHLDLDLERDDALMAIATVAPRSFADVGCQPWPSVEAVLRRGLAKDAASRQASVVELRDELIAAAGSSPWPGTSGPERVVGRFLLRDYDIHGTAWAEADPEEAAVRAAELEAAAVATGSVDAHDLAILWRART